jgi:hypothetical protein
MDIMAFPFWRRKRRPAPTKDMRKHLIHLPEAALANGIRISGSSGSGKTLLASRLAYNRFRKGQANCLIVPKGNMGTVFLDLVRRDYEAGRLSEADLARIIICELSGRSGYIAPFSLLRRFPDERLAVVADRVMAWIQGIMPESKGAAVEGYNSIAKVMRPAITLLAALAPALQITEMPDLLLNHKQPVWRDRLAQAQANFPDEMGEVATFFQYEFDRWPGQVRERRLNLLEVVLQPFRYDPVLRATFGAAQAGLDYETITREGITVIIDGSGLEGEYLQQILQWIFFQAIIAFLHWRGSGRHAPLGIILDELSTFHADSPEAMDLFAQRFGQVAHVLKRHYQVKPFIVIHQNEAQLHPKMAAHLAAFGNQIIGKPPDYESALALAEQLFDYRPLVKRRDPIYMNLPDRGPVVVDHRPVEYRRDELLHMQAQLLMRLDTFKFLCRLTKREGGGQGPLRQLDIAPLVGPFPDEAKVATLRQQLIAASGIPIRQVLAEIEDRKTPQGSSVTVLSNKQIHDHDPDDYIREQE